MLICVHRTNVLNILDDAALGGSSGDNEHDDIRNMNRHYSKD